METPQNWVSKQELEDLTKKAHNLVPKKLWIFAESLTSNVSPTGFIRDKKTLTKPVGQTLDITDSSQFG